jgi:hypothetical protein
VREEASMKRCWAALIVLTCLLGATVAPAAQFRGLGRVTGTVTDESGAPLKDVSIHATLAGQDGVLEEKSDGKGWWALSSMARGEWHLVFHAPGYAPVAAKVLLEAELAHINPIAVVLKKASK